MKIIYSTGGGGSSFVSENFKKSGWSVCERPDGGQQKATHTTEEIFIQRTKRFFKNELEPNKNYSQKELFDLAYPRLKKYEMDRKWRGKKLMLLSMSWGGMDFLNNLEEKTIFLIRDPLFAFNSYSGGGWRSEGGKRRIEYVGANSPNDKKWINKFLGDFSMWVRGAENALKANKNGTGYVVRYHNFQEDWSKIDGLPPIHKNFSCKDKHEKLLTLLNQDTINYIKGKTNDIWNEICSL